MLCAANGAPVVVAKLAPSDRSAPLDFGYRLFDGQRLFGDHKTWRGLIFGTAACALLAGVLGIPAWLGVGFGAASLFGDACSSAVKRRRGLTPGTQALGLDQLPEALLPMILFAGPLSLQFRDIIAATLVFICLDIVATRMCQTPWLRSFSAK